MLKPELRFAAEGSAIYDSRTGVAEQYPLSALARAVLRKLEKPTRRADLSTVFGLREDELDAELAVLNDRRLLFKEADRMLSLVCSDERPGTQVLRSKSVERHVPIKVAELAHADANFCAEGLMHPHTLLSRDGHVTGLPELKSAP